METEWIRIEEAMEILGLSYSGVYYRTSVGLLETRMQRQGSFQWLLLRRTQCEEHAANPPSCFRRQIHLPEKLGQWTEVEIAQWATLVDTEGCIAIHLNKQGARNTASHALRISITNTHSPLIEGLRCRFGGNMQIEPHRKRPKWRPVYRWWTGATRALVLLELAEPYFLIKQEEAAVAIAFQRRINDYAAVRTWRTPVAPEELEWRQSQMDLLSALKHRVVDHL